jgi:hypothetical protein
MREGPELYYLIQKLQNTPLNLIQENIINSEKKINKHQHVLSISKSVFFNMGQEAKDWNSFELVSFNKKDAITEIRYLQICLLIFNILNDDFFYNRIEDIPNAKKLFGENLVNLINLVEPSEFIFDDERREELVRYILLHLDYYPKGENENKAKDRFTSIDSIERKRMIDASIAAQKRAKELREAMERQEAEEAASKWNRE